MNVFENMAAMSHEEVVFCHDHVSGLKAIIGIHDTTLGPALGGCRMWSYANEADALNDVLRLSRGMTYKAAISGLNLGGGKAVIIGNSKTDANEMLFRAYGRYVQGLDGRYITAEDVGTSVREMEWVRMETDHVTGISRSLGGSGDPSPVTAFGVFQGIRASLKWRTGSDSLTNRVVAVQGLGHVGYYLVKHLHEAGAQIIATDISQERIKAVAADFPGVEFVAPDRIHSVGCDVFAPCALGAVVNDDTIPELRCSIVAGATNNVLADEDVHSVALVKRDILYAPDYVVNAGGLMNVANELEGYNQDRALKQAGSIYDITTRIFETARAENTTTLLAANTLAERRIATLAKIKDRYVGRPPRRFQR
jgi:leucine dehydrogenase